MRVTEKTKTATRSRILDSSRKLFIDNGLDGTTTRDIARRARIAAGTLFNYFPSKEAVAMTIIADALDDARERFRERRRGEASLEEDLFAHVIMGLRALEPYRKFVGPVIEAMMSPFSKTACCQAGERLRVDHMEMVGELIARRHSAGLPSFVAVHLYWTLYLGVVAYWSTDESSHQENTLVVLDQSLRLFTQSLSENSSPTEVSHGA